MIRWLNLGQRRLKHFKHMLSFTYETKNFGTDYAIHALNESYDLTIGSRLETPTEKRFRQNARAKMFMDLIQSGGEIDVDEAFPESDD